jgi:hypothetical protein
MKKFLSCALVLPFAFLILSPISNGPGGKTFARSIEKAKAVRSFALSAGPAVLTQHNDTSRTGANLNETFLNTSSVRPATFGKLFSRPVDGYIYAQPLYAPGVSIPQAGVHNVVYVATEHNSVFAYDADDPAAQSPLWQVGLGDPVPSTDISPDYTDLTPEIGITSTPVIDGTSGTIYVVAKSKDTAGYHQRLHALDITTGSERPASPVEITASVEGNGDGSVGGIINFNPLMQLNRPGLLLKNGIVYIAFGSHGDYDPYHGWVIGYNAATLDQVAVYNTTPDGGRGAVWQAGQGLVGADDGSIYFVTGNGTCDSADNCGRNLGESFVRLSALLTPLDWFTPDNRLFLDGEDLDFGSGGPVMIPGTNILAAAGKDGTMRVVDGANMGKFNVNTDQDLQEFPSTAYGFLGAPVYWNSPVWGQSIYVWGGGDNLKAFQFNGSEFQPTPTSQSTTLTPIGLTNTAPLSLSANGSEEGTGVIWASCPDSPNPGPVPAVLRAFDASDLAVELWDSNMNPDRDGAGLFAKFCPPTVAGGKVYVPTFSGQLNVYGLLPSCTVALSNTQQVMLATGGAGEVNVTAGDDCSWTATSDAAFITIDAGASGTGSGTINFVVAPNPGTQRTGAIEVAGQILTVTQDAGCSFALDPSDPPGVQFKWKGGSASISVQENGSCSWTASSDVSWITITSGATGSGSSSVSIAVDRNPDKSTSRSGHLIVAGTAVTITQLAKRSD